MDLDHSFTVPVGIDEAWSALLDIRRIAPCMPGAAIDTVDGDDFTGTVKVKLGPIGLTYKGKASFVEKDEAAHRAVIDARGRDARGNGTAAAKVTATLREDGDGTAVDVHTELDITGKPAQFGRGVMVDVGNKLIGQFADNLAAELRGPDSDAADAAAGSFGDATTDETPDGSTGAAGGSVGDSSAAGTDRDDAAAPAKPAAARAQPDVEPINLISSAGPAVVKRLAPVAVAVLVLLVVLGYRRRRSR